MFLRRNKGENSRKKKTKSLLRNSSDKNISKTKSFFEVKSIKKTDTLKEQKTERNAEQKIEEKCMILGRSFSKNSFTCVDTQNAITVTMYSSLIIIISPSKCNQLMFHITTVATSLNIEDYVMSNLPEDANLESGLLN